MMMTSTTNDTHNNATTAEASILSDSSLHEIENECDDTDGNEDFFKYDNYDDLVELEEEDDDNCNDLDHCDDEDGEMEEEEERDLTNLTWLTELRNQTIGFVNMPLDDDKRSEVTGIAVGQQKQQIVQSCHYRQHLQELLQKSSLNAIEQQSRLKVLHRQEQKAQELHTSSKTSAINQQSKRPSPTERYEMFLNKIKRDLEIYQQSAMSYQSDITEKPPFNYSHIIGMAMLENGRRVTLQQICTWIETKFAFFRVRKKWNNSIRHNLSLHPCFRKIGRNKEDKGKGGYWELGVDPKKCDRKRIRNRKSTSQAAKIQNKHLQTYSKTSNRRSQQHLSSLKKSNFKCFSGYLKPLLNNSKEHEYEELLLDDMDVQQNIDVTSTNNKNVITSDTSSFFGQTEVHHAVSEAKQQQNSVMLSKTDGEQVLLTDLINDSIHINDDTNLDEFNNCPLAADHIHHHHHEQMSPTKSCHQEYKLGTIIISSTSMAELANIHNINPSTLNSFVNTSSIKQLTETKEHTTTHQLQQQHHNILYTEDDIPEISESVIISSYMSNLADDNYATCTHESKFDQCHPATTTSSSTITLDFSTSPIQPRPNVIVEQLMQPSLTLTAIGSSATLNTVCTSTNATSSSTSTIALTAAPNSDYSNLGNDHFRPYIDGIDEAFQYLRSMDNTRNEDILDNLLDISVSDY